MREISPCKLIEYIETNPESLELIDVRQKYEYLISHLVSSKSIPLPEIAARSIEINPQKIIILISRSGMRGASAAAILENMESFNGSNILNLKEGLLGVARQPLGSLAIIRR